MIRLKDIEKAMRPQFVFDPESYKLLQTLESHEGSKEIARMIFVGICDMYGYESSQITEYLDMGYDSYRHKIQLFRANYKECLRQAELGEIDQSLIKFYTKLRLCLNAIKSNTDTNPYFKLKNYL